MTKSGKNTNNTNKSNQLVAELKKRIEELEVRNKSLEDRMGLLEEKQGVLSHVNGMLSQEVDRLNQYTRRSNIVLKNVFVPENETVDQVEKEVKNIITKMGLPEVIPDFDKAHRLGKPKSLNGKKHQDVNVRFKSHSARYKVFDKRKSAKNIRIAPNLTRTRSKLLSDAVELTKQIETSQDDWGFVFANSHGDLLLRLKEKVNGKQYFPFDTVDSLTKTLCEVGFLTQ